MREKPNVAIKVMERYGPTTFCILLYIVWRMFNNRKSESNKNEGKYWVYESYRTFSEKTGIGIGSLRSNINKLEDLQVILAGNFNQMPGDKTKWYTIIDPWVLGEFGYEKQTEINLMDIPHTPLCYDESGLEFIDYSSIPEEYQIACEECKVTPPVYKWAIKNENIEVDFINKLTHYNALTGNRKPQIFKDKLERDIASYSEAFSDRARELSAEDKNRCADIADKLYHDYTVKFYYLSQKKEYAKRARQKKLKKEEQVVVEPPHPAQEEVKNSEDA